MSMNPLSAALLTAGLALTLSFAPREELYQVIDAHPHAVAELTPFVETAHQSGRLWVVRPRAELPAHVRRSLRRLRGGERSYRFLDRLKERLPGPRARALRERIAGVDGERIKRDVALLAGLETRVAGSAGNREAVALVAERLRGLGYVVSFSCYAPAACNVIAERPGQVAPEHVSVVMAHVDSVGEAFAGADDNATGVASLLEIGRVLAAHPNRKSVRLVVTNGEEQGLLGSVFYARELERAGTLREIGLLINMDMIGYNQDGVLELETSAEQEATARWLGQLALRYTALSPKITVGAWGSDHVPFLRRGVPAVLTIENWDTKNPCYHRSCDTPEKINYAYATEVARLNAAALLDRDAE
jgi:hypothetical protein